MEQVNQLAILICNFLLSLSVNLFLFGFSVGFILQRQQRLIKFDDSESDRRIRGG